MVICPAETLKSDAFCNSFSAMEGIVPWKPIERFVLLALTADLALCPARAPHHARQATDVLPSSLRSGNVPPGTLTRAPDCWRCLVLVVEPLWRNGRAFDPDPEGLGFGSRSSQLHFSRQGNQSALLGGPVCCERSFDRDLFPHPRLG